MNNNDRISTYIQNGSFKFTDVVEAIGNPKHAVIQTIFTDSQIQISDALKAKHMTIFGKAVFWCSRSFYGFFCRGTKYDISKQILLTYRNYYVSEKDKISKFQIELLKTGTFEDKPSPWMSQGTIENKIKSVLRRDDIKNVVKVDEQTIKTEIIKLLITHVKDEIAKKNIPTSIFKRVWATDDTNQIASKPFLSADWIKLHQVLKEVEQSYLKNSKMLEDAFLNQKGMEELRADPRTIEEAKNFANKLLNTALQACVNTCDQASFEAKILEQWMHLRQSVHVELKKFRLPIPRELDPVIANDVNKALEELESSGIADFKAIEHESFAFEKLKQHYKEQSNAILDEAIKRNNVLSHQKVSENLEAEVQKDNAPLIDAIKTALGPEDSAPILTTLEIALKGILKEFRECPVDDVEKKEKLAEQARNFILNTLNAGIEECVLKLVKHQETADTLKDSQISQTRKIQFQLKSYTRVLAHFVKRLICSETNQGNYFADDQDTNFRQIFETAKQKILDQKEVLLKKNSEYQETFRAVITNFCDAMGELFESSWKDICDNSKIKGKLDFEHLLNDAFHFRFTMLKLGNGKSLKACNEDLKSLQNQIKEKSKVFFNSEFLVPIELLQGSVEHQIQLRKDLLETIVILETQVRCLSKCTTIVLQNKPEELSISENQASNPTTEVVEEVVNLPELKREIVEAPLVVAEAPVVAEAKLKSDWDSIKRAQSIPGFILEPVAMFTGIADPIKYVTAIVPALAKFLTSFHPVKEHKKVLKFYSELLLNYIKTLTPQDFDPAEVNKKFESNQFQHYVDDVHFIRYCRKVLPQLGQILSLWKNIVPPQFMVEDDTLNLDSRVLGIVGWALVNQNKVNLLINDGMDLLYKKMVSSGVDLNSDENDEAKQRRLQFYEDIKSSFEGVSKIPAVGAARVGKILSFVGLESTLVNWMLPFILSKEYEIDLNIPKNISPEAKAVKEKKIKDLQQANIRIQIQNSLIKGFIANHKFTPYIYILASFKTYLEKVLENMKYAAIETEEKKLDEALERIAENLTYEEERNVSLGRISRLEKAISWFNKEKNKHQSIEELQVKINKTTSDDPVIEEAMKTIRNFLFQAPEKDVKNLKVFEEFLITISKTLVTEHKGKFKNNTDQVKKDIEDALSKAPEISNFYTIAYEMVDRSFVRKILISKNSLSKFKAQVKKASASNPFDHPDVKEAFKDFTQSIHAAFDNAYSELTSHPFKNKILGIVGTKFKDFAFDPEKDANVVRAMFNQIFIPIVQELTNLPKELFKEDPKIALDFGS